MTDHDQKQRDAAIVRSVLTQARGVDITEALLALRRLERAR